MTSIQRIVVGLPESPKSTRSLVGVSREEFTHLRLAVTGMAAESALMAQMDDFALAELARQVELAREITEIPSISQAGTDPEGFRALQIRNIESAETLLEYLDGFQDGEIHGIPPSSFAALISAVQGALRECQVIPLFGDQFERGAGLLREKYLLSGVEAPEYWRAEFGVTAEWFSRREKVLLAILRVINRPYVGVGMN